MGNLAQASENLLAVLPARFAELASQVNFHCKFDQALRALSDMEQVTVAMP